MKQQQLHNINTVFIPTSKQEMTARGWAELDILFISGDAYIDHPAFGTALLARLLESFGFKVGILAQPDWKDPAALSIMGRPRLFAAISAGAMDSMVNHYTAAKKIRSNDAYTPGGIAGKRPNRAIIAYTAAIKGTFKGLPTVIGGIEASLRRVAHYDYWSDKVRRSVLIDSKADILIYGMAETAILEIAQHLQQGETISTLTSIKGTAYATSKNVGNNVELPSFELVSTSKDAYNKAFKLANEQENPFSAKPLIQPHGGRNLVINPPALPLQESELDQLYALPYTRQPHPSYTETIPAFTQIQNSITSHRGCFGGCSFCAITHHQGKTIQSRSIKSILAEIDKVTEQKQFKGTISDIGGPTANMYGLYCGNHPAEKVCQRASCIYPQICKNLITADKPATTLLAQVRSHPKIKHSFIASGIRYDLLPVQHDYFTALLQYHIGGLLKVAPESTSDSVTKVMGKPDAHVFTKFLEQFRLRSHNLGLRQSIVPYLISGHPGSTLNAMIDVAIYLKQHHLKVEQVQDFTATPGSLSTCIYYTGKNPLTNETIHIPRTVKERRLQKSLLLFHKPEAKKDILEALKICKRQNIANELFDKTGKTPPKQRPVKQKQSGSSRLKRSQKRS